MTQAATKQADIRYRVELKKNSGIVIYRCVSSNGVDEYDVTLYNGRVSSCTCPAHQKSGVTCYIITGVLAKEAEVQARRREEDKAAMDTLAQEIAASKPAPVAQRGQLNRRELNIVNGIIMR